MENKMAYGTVGIAYSISRAKPDRIDRVEVVLTGSREEFLDEMVKEFEERHGQKFYKEKESYDKNNRLIKAIYYAAATQVDLIILFDKKNLEDLSEENYLKPKKDQVRTITYPDHLHARVQVKSEVLGTRDRTIGIMGNEGYLREDIKDDFLIYILAKTGDEYDSYYNKKSKSFDKNNCLTEARYEFPNAEMELIVSFFLDDLTCQVSYENYPPDIQVLDDDNVVNLDKVA